MSVTLAGFNVSAPSTAPTAAAGTTSGSLDTSASYSYKVTYVTGFGETTGSSAGSASTDSTGSMNLTAIPVSSDGNVIQRKIYRTVGGGSSYLLLATIDDNTTTTYTDIIADGSLGAAMPTLNSAHSLQVVNGFIKHAKPSLVSSEISITAGAGGTGSAAYRLSNEFNLISTVATTNDSVMLPEISTALIGTRVVIRNNGANTARVYPYTGQTINGGSADSPVTVATVTTISFVATAAANWTQY